MSIPIFLVLTSLAIFTSCYRCPNTFPAPENLAQVSYFPYIWFDNEPIPIMDPYHQCQVLVTVPRGYYANVTFYRQYSQEGGSYVTYSNQGRSSIINNDQNPFIFVSPRFTVHVQPLEATDPYHFAFKIQYFPFPGVYLKTIDLNKGEPPVVQNPIDKFVTFRGSSTAALMGFSLADPSMNYLLRQSVIYDGYGFDTNFIGTLEHVMNNGYPLSPYLGSSVSIYTFGLNNVIDYPLYMGQSQIDARKYDVYQGANCPSTGNCIVSLKGIYKISMTVTYSNETETITGFDSFPAYADLNVYENSVSASTKIASLTHTNYLEQLPLEVNGPMRFYEIVGRAEWNMTVTRSSQ